MQGLSRRRPLLQRRQLTAGQSPVVRRELGLVDARLELRVPRCSGQMTPRHSSTSG